MSDKTIKERGISTITLPAPAVFSFDEKTRKEELVYYYQYCLTHSLITVTGEQSRTTLIRKTFNHLGGTGTTWNAAMISWLQGQLTSSSTNLYALWLAYFTLHASTPDDEGITYAGLSVESAYRRFLSDFIGGNVTLVPPYIFNSSDPLMVTDSFSFKQGKVFSDTVSPSDAVNFIIHYIRTFSDSLSLSDAMIIKYKKFFNDSVTPSDAFLTRLAKGFADALGVTDSAAFKAGFIKAFNDTALVTDTVAIRRLLIYADSFSITDAIMYHLRIIFADSLSLSDSLVATLGFAQLFSEPLDIDDTFFIRLLKVFADSVSMSDSVSFSVGGYNQGLYNTGVYNR